MLTHFGNPQLPTSAGNANSCSRPSVLKVAVVAVAAELLCLGITLNYLRDAAGNGRVKRSSTYDPELAPPRATAWAPQVLNSALRCTTSAAAGNGLDTTIEYMRRTTSCAVGSDRAQRSSTYDAQRADWPGHHDQVPARRREHRPEHHDRVPERRRRHRSWHHD
jgi:hypothetical protein